MYITQLVIGLAVFSQLPTTEADNAALLHRYYISQADEYHLFRENEEQPLKLRHEPVLNWLNADNYLGSVFVWTYDGRPEVIGCIGSRQTADGECFVFHELHSLSLSILSPVTFGDGKRKWKPAAAGVELRTIDGAPEPARAEPQRLTQMRNLAREFTGWMKQDGDVTELRLLPQPIWRYHAAEQKIVDGALFALVWKGTDPEILLMLECHEDQGKQSWKYALARFNWHEMWVHRQDKEIWRVQTTGMSNTSAYISGRVGQTNLSAIGKTLSKEKPN